MRKAWLLFLLSTLGFVTVGCLNDTDTAGGGAGHEGEALVAGMFPIP